MSGAAPNLSAGRCVSLAIAWEVTASKPGNVHRGADFEDVTFADFLLAAEAIGAAIDSATEAGTERRIGTLVLAAVEAMRQVVETNTSLGTVLLAVPLVLAGREDLRSGVRRVLAESTADDTALVYRAIRRSGAGELGTAAEGDVAGPPPALALVSVMRLAAERDAIARQYVADFADVFRAADNLQGRLAAGESLHDAIVATHIELLAECGDSLVARKLGDGASEAIRERARAIVLAGGPATDFGQVLTAELDFYLRCDGHRRNPGTTADLVAAALLVLLLEHRLDWPVRFYGSRESD